VSGADSWQNFYVMVGGAAAALTGLILVAVSLHLPAILGHPLYRDRAFTSLQGLVTILVVAAAALTPQSPDALGIEVLALGLYWLVRFARFIRLFTRVRPRDRAAPGSLWLWEWLLWVAWVVALAGGGVLLLGSDPRAFTS
jgi:modulator of FtsH protease